MHLLATCYNFMWKIMIFPLVLAVVFENVRIDHLLLLGDLCLWHHMLSARSLQRHHDIGCAWLFVKAGKSLAVLLTLCHFCSRHTCDKLSAIIGIQVVHLFRLMLYLLPFCCRKAIGLKRIKKKLGTNHEDLQTLSRVCSALTFCLLLCRIWFIVYSRQTLSKAWQKQSNALSFQARI